MQRKHFFVSVITILAAVAALSFFGVQQQQVTPRAHAKGLDPTPGSLLSLDPEGQPSGLCPLKHTDVKADISGPLARVTVKQQFENPFEDKIEAVYAEPPEIPLRCTPVVQSEGESMAKARMTLASQLSLERARSAALWAAFNRLLALSAKRRLGTPQNASETARKRSVRCSCGCRNQDFHFGPGTVAVYTRAAPKTTSFRAEPCTSPPPVGARARPSAHRR